MNHGGKEAKKRGKEGKAEDGEKRREKGRKKGRRRGEQEGSRNRGGGKWKTGGESAELGGKDGGGVGNVIKKSDEGVWEGRGGKGGERQHHSKDGREKERERREKRGSRRMVGAIGARGARRIGGGEEGCRREKEKLEGRGGDGGGTKGGRESRRG